jgi:RimJ/RimL family protein N-acetyltransferase
MLAPPPTVDTPRLRLRIPRESDADAIFAGYARDPEVSRYMTWRPHETVADSRAFLSTVLQSWQLGVGERSWAIERRDEGDVIGMLGVRAHHGTCLGYVLARPHWGRGYMTEAARAVVALALTESWRVWAFCDVDNVGSARVMEKAGMSFEGVLRRYSCHPNLGPEPRDCRVYSTVR